MENIKITITWNKRNSASLWWDDKLIWETKEVTTETDFLTTELYLPVLEALRFCSIFIRGTSARLIAELLIKIDKKINKFKAIQKQAEKQKQIDSTLEWDW